MYERIQQCDEWLLFSWEGLGFAVPNQRSHLIDLATTLESSPEGWPAAWYLHRRGRCPIHCLDRELAPCPEGAANRPLFVLFGGHATPFGLLSDQADVVRFRERGLQIHPIPPALRHPRSPLLGIAIGSEGEPVLLSDVEALNAFLAKT